MAKETRVKPAERYDHETFDEEPLDPYETYEGRMEAWLDQRDVLLEIHLRARP